MARETSLNVDPDPLTMPAPLRSETARALASVLVSQGVSFVSSPIRVDGHAARLGFPPALDADGERLRREFGLPMPREA